LEGAKARDGSRAHATSGRPPSGGRISGRPRRWFARKDPIEHANEETFWRRQKRSSTKLLRVDKGCHYMFILAAKTDLAEFRRLIAVTATPLLRDDGSIRVTDGYDERTRVAALPCG
jgi:hypothetical protein